VFVDVDNFKRVNDSYSHVVGDRVLVRLAAILRSAARSPDTVVRYGGDEFLVLLDPRTTVNPGVAEKAVVGLARRILEVVRDYEWGELAGGLTVTVSVGVVLGATPADVLASASAALHEAKTSGRNRLVIAGPLPVGVSA